MKTVKTLLVTALYLLFIITSDAQKIWPEQTFQTKPWTRWWWMGNAVNEKDLSASLAKYKQAGFGGVEIAPIYGAIGYEKQYINYLSPAWVKMLDYTVATAGKLGMGVDLTTGTGWPFGGPQVTTQYAASKMIIRRYPSLKPGDKIKLANDDETLQSLTGYAADGRIVDLMDKVDKDGFLQWRIEAGVWDVYAFFNGKTKQKVKRAAPGGEGFSLDHFSAPALNVYLHRFDTAFHQRSHGVRAYYNDSYEVYGADWTADFTEQFYKRKRYDLQPYIRSFYRKDSSETMARVKSDYREVMSDLILNNFTRPWTQWAHQYKAISKNQAHGSPGNLLDLYAAVDIPECETYGSTYFPIPGLRRDSADIRNVDPDPVMLKFASSAAHVNGHPLVSSETFTWLTEHFKTSLSQCKPEVEQCFLAGVNHVFFHGVTYSPEAVKWPGWLFYASTNFVPSNSFWPHLPGLTNYITRVQSVLQTGKPDNELLIYWPIYDIWNNPKGNEITLKVHDIDQWLHPSAFYSQVVNLQKAGYSLDFISDNLLEKAAVKEGFISTNDPSSAYNLSSPYKVLIVPASTMMPLGTLQKIIALAQQGATVMIEALPEDVPGLIDVQKRREQLKKLLASIPFADNGVAKMGKGQIILAPDMQQALEQQGIRREALTDAGLKFIRRKAGDDTYYYIVNHTPKTVDQYLPVNASSGTVIIMDPQTGDYGKATTNSTGVKIQLQPGEALILKATSIKDTLRAWTYLDKSSTPISLDGPWALQFTQGGPYKPAPVTMPALVSWTTLTDTATHSFSGTGVYQQSFTLPATNAKEYVLDLGEVHESAHVWINGQDAGILWSIPFKTRIGKFLKPGKNEIRIEVANLMANRIKYMDEQKIPWRRYHEINFVNINYTDFDASGWKLQPSGLIGPVVITPYM
ncbi:Glycosyl hydrolases family 2, sugar binding domain [Chitinophaga sp. YR573]|uniref:glycosyl hydrolase n=1 Tax=Chitinophaga sp. YR573 TaxID=1881040 RepID=UPI0008C3FE48|nr:glycosyl hydrolase [Chitinophaga sp. YR573]SEW45293.1 Glycosyl hydrolases family 2, sugar binding domain [Chitinophaga sp. YR573]